jgi:hypothetical protein
LVGEPLHRWAARRIGARRHRLRLFLHGPVQALGGRALAAVILGEPIRLTFVVGGALVLIGVWIGAFSAKSVPRPAASVIEEERAHLPVIADGGGPELAGREPSPQG